MTDNGSARSLDSRSNRQFLAASDKDFSISENGFRRLNDFIQKYPDKRSAVMPALYIVQEERGFVSLEGICWVSERLGLSAAQVLEVVTFYTMFYKKPVGKYHFQVCRTVSCALRGASEIMAALAKRFDGLLPNEVSADGKWSYEEVECLGSCGTAPVCQINDHLFENLTPEKLLAIIERIEKESPDLRFSTIKDRLGEGLKDYPKSEIC